MRNRITALAFAVALGVSAAQAQQRDDADSSALDETVTDRSVEEAVQAAAEAGERQNTQEQDERTSADARTDDAGPGRNAPEGELVAEGDEKGEPVDVDAKDIEAAVRASINMSTPVGAEQIDVKARDDGTVTLTGSVPSEAQKKLVETVASNSPAVRELRSQLVVREPGQLPPETPVEN